MCVFDGNIFFLAVFLMHMCSHLTLRPKRYSDDVYIVSEGWGNYPAHHRPTYTAQTAVIFNCAIYQHEFFAPNAGIIFLNNRLT